MVDDILDREVASSPGCRPCAAARRRTAGLGLEDYEKGENAPIVSVPAAPPSPQRLPYFGMMGDVGVPDGLIGSLVARPWTWLRLSGGGGSNGISKGWRTGITFLPFTAGPSASFEYGHYQDGNANSLAKKVIGGSFDGSPLLERVGYDYLNAHLGLDFGSRRVVFFLHGGVTFLRGQIHNVEAPSATPPRKAPPAQARPKWWCPRIRRSRRWDRRSNWG